MSSKHNRFAVNALKKLVRRYDVEAVKEYSKKIFLYYPIQIRKVASS